MNVIQREPETKTRMDLLLGRYSDEVSISVVAAIGCHDIRRKIDIKMKELCMVLRIRAGL